MTTEIAVLHTPKAWGRCFEPPFLYAADDRVLAPDVVLVNGPVGVALQDIQGEVWWHAFWRKTGRVYGSFPDLDLAKIFADSFRAVPGIEEMVQVQRTRNDRLGQCITALRRSVFDTARSGQPPIDPSTKRPAEFARFSYLS